MARAFGTSLVTTLKEPYALTLWAWHELQQQQHLDALTREHERIDGAGLTAVAFHDPKQLGAIEQRFLAKLHHNMETPAERAAWRDAAADRVRRLHGLRLIPEEMPGG